MCLINVLLICLICLIWYKKLDLFRSVSPPTDQYYPARPHLQCGCNFFYFHLLPFFNFKCSICDAVYVIAHLSKIINLFQLSIANAKSIVSVISKAYCQYRCLKKSMHPHCKCGRARGLLFLLLYLGRSKWNLVMVVG